MLFNSPFEKVFYSPIDKNDYEPESFEKAESTVARLINYVISSRQNVNPAVLLQLIKDLNEEEVLAMREISNVNDSPFEFEGGGKH